MGKKKASDGLLIAAKCSNKHVSLRINHKSSESSHCKASWLKSYQRWDVTHKHVHMVPLILFLHVSCFNETHSAYPLPSLCPYIPTKWMCWGSISLANRVRIVPVFISSFSTWLSGYEDTAGVLSAFSPWLAVVFDCLSHLRSVLVKSRLNFSKVSGCCRIGTCEFRICVLRHLAKVG